MSLGEGRKIHHDITALWLGNDTAQSNRISSRSELSVGSFEESENIAMIVIISSLCVLCMKYAVGAVVVAFLET